MKPQLLTKLMYHPSPTYKLLTNIKPYKHHFGGNWGFGAD